MTESEKETLLLLAYLYLQHSKADKSLALLEALRLLFVADSRVARALSYAYFTVGNFRRAVEEADHALSFSRTAREERLATLLLKSRALFALSRQEEARQVLSEYLALANPPAGGQLQLSSRTS